jgi:hypothetical protein
MHAITWKPGENKQLDELFDKLREQQFSLGDRLSYNYNTHMLSSVIALTITFDDEIPVVCSTIASKNIWPQGVYRIYNRTWKPTRRKESIHRGVTPEMALTGKSQIKWLEENTDCKLYFFSRETKNWRTWSIRSLKRDHEMEFLDGEHEYLTCENKDDPKCWQTMIYNGDSSLLKNWPHK